MSYTKTVYPNAVEHQLEDGSVVFTVEMTVGGIDEEGEYLLVLDGPAQGEKVYDL